MAGGWLLVHSALEKRGQDALTTFLWPRPGPGLALSISRRHLAVGQRSMIGAKLVTMMHGGDRTTQNSKIQNYTLISRSQVSVAAMLRHRKSVKRASLERARPPILADNPRLFAIPLHALPLTFGILVH